jgi:hypothetical protein
MLRTAKRVVVADSSTFSCWAAYLNTRAEELHVPVQTPDSGAGCVLLLDGGDGGFSTQGDEAYVPGAANKARRRLPRTILHAPLFGLWNGTLVSNHNQNNNDDNGGGGGGGGGGDSHANAHRRWRQRRGRSLLKDEARATNNSSGGGGDDSWLSADKAGCRWRFDSRHLNLKANSWKDVENSAAAAAAAAAAADK